MANRFTDGSSGSSSVAKSTDEAMSQQRNLTAVAEVLGGKRKVANAVWWGFNPDDSTYAIQSAIDSGATTVIVPNVGADWIVEPITLTSNQNIIFQPGATVIAKQWHFKALDDCLFYGFKVTDVTISGYGATLKMRKSDYQSAAYASGEARHVISLESCENITIQGLNLNESGGDGIFLTRDRQWIIDYGVSLPCKNIWIKDCTCDSNHRQGLSVICGENVLIEDCVFSNTSGTPPASGLDLEPNHPTDRLVNVVVRNCTSINNAIGFVVSISFLDDISEDISVLFDSCYATDCTVAGLFLWAATEDQLPDGLIEFRDCVTEDMSFPGLRGTWKINPPLRVLFNNCRWTNVATSSSRRPIELTLKKAESPSGGIEFSNNCRVYDDVDRDFLKVIEVAGGSGDYDIKGTINVYNQYGATIDANEELTELTVNDILA